MTSRALTPVADLKSECLTVRPARSVAKKSFDSPKITSLDFATKYPVRCVVCVGDGVGVGDGVAVIVGVGEGVGVGVGVGVIATLTFFPFFQRRRPLERTHRYMNPPETIFWPTRTHFAFGTAKAVVVINPLAEAKEEKTSVPSIARRVSGLKSIGEGNQSPPPSSSRNFTLGLPHFNRTQILLRELRERKCHSSTTSWSFFTSSVWQDS
jgi:hypothetical protein